MGPEKQSEEVKALPYRQLTGALLYLRLTRPDILVPVTMGAKQAKKWTRQAWKHLKYICRYLQGTPHLGLKYQAGKEYTTAGKVYLEAWVDADYATDPETRVSRTGYFIFINNKCLVAFGSRLQKGPASTGTCEAEYRALAAAVKELIWIYMIICSLGFHVQLPMPVHEDNQAAERLAKDYGCQKRTKHIDVRFHYVRQLEEAGIIAVRYKRSEEQLADLLTKNLPTVAFTKIRDNIMYNCKDQEHIAAAPSQEGLSDYSS